MNRGTRKRIKRLRLRRWRRERQLDNIYWHWLLTELGPDGCKELGEGLKADRLAAEAEKTLEVYEAEQANIAKHAKKVSRNFTEPAPAFKDGLHEDGAEAQ